MNERDLVRGVGEIEEWIVQEAEEQPVRLRKRKWNFAPAAGFAAAAMVVVSISWATIWMNHKNTLVDQEISSVAEMTEKMTGSIPLEADERLVILKEDGTLLIYDQNGTIVGHQQSVTWMGKPDTPVIGRIVSMEDVLLLGTVGETDQESSGFYSVSKSDWMVKPEDGKVLAPIGNNENYITDGSRIFNQNGMLIGTVTEGEIIDSWDDTVLVEAERDNGIIYHVYNVQGELLSAMEPGAIFVGRCEEYLNWMTESGQGMVTDLALNVVMTEEEFWQRNEWRPKGNGFAVVRSYFDGKKRLLIKTKDWYGSGEENVYLVCGAEFDMMWLPTSVWTETSGIWSNVDDGEFSEDEWLSEDYGDCQESWVILDEYEDGIYIGRLEDRDIRKLRYYGSGSTVVQVKAYEGAEMVLHVKEQKGEDRIEKVLANGADRVALVNGTVDVEITDDMGYVIKMDALPGDVMRIYYRADGTCVFESTEPDETGYYAGADFYCGEDDNGIYVKVYETGEKVYLEGLGCLKQ